MLTFKVKSQSRSAAGFLIGCSLAWIALSGSAQDQQANTQVSPPQYGNLDFDSCTRSQPEDYCRLLLSVMPLETDARPGGTSPCPGLAVGVRVLEGYAGETWFNICEERDVTYVSWARSNKGLFDLMPQLKRGRSWASIDELTRQGVLKVLSADSRSFPEIKRAAHRLNELRVRVGSESTVTPLHGTFYQVFVRGLVREVLISMPAVDGDKYLIGWIKDFSSVLEKVSNQMRMREGVTNPN